MKTGQWIFYKNEWWNIYKIITDSIILHPSNDDGISNGSLITVKLSDVNPQ